MAVPMPKKRTWSTRETDAESKETAAFEATVAAAQDTAAKSGAFLSTAKSDLTDHQRWLQAQSVAVERDRARHERWLQRQREHRLTLARKDRARRRRQLMRQRAIRAVQAAALASLVFVRSLIMAAAANVAAGATYVGSLIARGAGYLGHLIAVAAANMAAGAKYLGSLIAQGAGYLGSLIAAGVHWTAAKLHIFAYLVGRKVATGSSAAAARAGVFSRSAGRSIGGGFGATGRSASRGLARFGDKASIYGAAGKRQLAAGFRWSSRRAAALAPTLYVRVAKLGRQAERYARARAAQAEGGLVRAKATAPARSAEAPSAVTVIYGPHRDGVGIEGRPANDPWTPAALPRAETAQPEVETAEVVEVYGPFYEGFWVEGVSPNEPRWPEPAPAPQAVLAAPRVKGENALSSWARDAWYRTQGMAAQAGDWARSRSWSQNKEAGFSQMMIIAGAVLLVCGGLLLGGGLFLRAGVGTTAATAASEETATGITWTFQVPGLPLPERAVFTLSGTPQSFRINGLSVGGVNNTDRPLTGVQAVLKPDVHRPDLKLTLQVDKPAVTASEEGTQTQALEVTPKDAVPPNSPFRLVFAFPPETMDGADGLTVQEFFESYGGLLLRIRYELDGKQRSLIQYLPTDMLKAQLAEVAAQAGGS